ncbi:hypothetical protein [Anaerobacillus sp. 1_MG-2023]|uniref:hypothetical protein n=1 Tax=Anaerobacillus sp. 1_MG-2023 TaxID=3062655 RepID=UPI0026E3CB63|nr:hypothetical protein [Anaerobacillus sp. 1_MG-2023]MDO6654530.1 hypothetical protein [Anaerobacillus sp. 1_MG-2023]
MINDKTASNISVRTYDEVKTEIRVKLVDNKFEIWKKIDTIENKETGLLGYVLRNSNTDEIVISFRGTEMPKSVTTKVETKYVGSPSQDAMLATGEASIENGNLLYEKNTISNAELAESNKDIKEDLEGIVLGNSNYTKRGMGQQPI